MFKYKLSKYHTISNNLTNDGIKSKVVILSHRTGKTLVITSGLYQMLINGDIHLLPDDVFFKLAYYEIIVPEIEKELEIIISRLGSFSSLGISINLETSVKNELNFQKKVKQLNTLINQEQSFKKHISIYLIWCIREDWQLKFITPIFNQLRQNNIIKNILIIEDGFFLEKQRNELKICNLKEIFILKNNILKHDLLKQLNFLAKKNKETNITYFLDHYNISYFTSKGSIANNKINLKITDKLFQSLYKKKHINTFELKKILSFFPRVEFLPSYHPSISIKGHRHSYSREIKLFCKFINDESPQPFHNKPQTKCLKCSFLPICGGEWSLNVETNDIICPSYITNLQKRLEFVSLLKITSQNDIKNIRFSNL